MTFLIIKEVYVRYISIVCEVMIEWPIIGVVVNREDKLKLCFHPQIDAGRPVEEVFELVRAVFTPKDEKVKCRCCAL